MKDIYEECPIYNTKLLTLKQTNMDDLQELLKCYSDEKAVPFFNSDNCHGDDFHYTTVERMKEAIDFWDFSYKNRYFVRWTVIFNETNEKVGTIEMFHRIAEDDFNHHGILRIDLQSKYEIQPVIDNILEIVDEHLYKEFDVEVIITKAAPEARERRASLLKKGYKSINENLFAYDDYFIKKKD
jgi:RimJ/RimL family protein N-acetyltransferase